MSKSSSIDKYEPINLDTTILKINVKTNGDLITKEYDLIPFHPNMSDMKDLSNNNYILFPSFVKVTMDYLKNAGVGTDYKKVFTQLDKYIDLMKFLTKPHKEVDDDYTLLVDQTEYKNYAMSFAQDFTTDITDDFREVQKYEPLTDKEIITNNIGIIKKIFLPKNGRFFILGHEYVINESKYLPPYVESSSINEKLKDRKNIPLNYTISVELQLLDVALNPGIGDFSKLTCKQKKISLNKDVKEVFGNAFGNKEEIKATLPPLVPTSTSSKRRFGKLQTEWEERNKYEKAALTENERIAQEKKWSPLQKKMAQLDKYQEDYNKIPPLWIKERKDLDMKYDAFEKEIEGYKKEVVNILSVNRDEAADIDKNSLVKDLIDAVVKKAETSINQLYPPSDDEKDTKHVDLRNLIISGLKNSNEDALKSIFAKDSSNKYLKPELKNIKDADENVVNAKYVEPFLVELREREKDVKALEEENNKYVKELGLMKDTDYNKSGKKNEQSKVQAALLKKKTDLRVLQEKYGEKNGEKLIKTWEDSLRKMDTLKNNIESEKNIGEKTILNDSVRKELNAKLSEIKVIKEKLLKANYFEGKYAELTKDEGNAYAKKPGERPIETVGELENNLVNLKDEYLEIAGKLGSKDKLQSFISLLNEDVERIKKLKKGKETEKDSKEKDLKKAVDQLEKFGKISLSKGNKNLSDIAAVKKDIQDLDKKTTKTPEEEKKLKELKDKLDKLEKSSTENESSGREEDLKKEQERLQGKINPLIAQIERIRKYEGDYNKIIADLKGYKDGDKNINQTIVSKKEELKRLRDTFVDETNAKSGGTKRTVGVGATKRKKGKKIKKWTKKMLANKFSKKFKKSLRRVRRKHKQKKKYTKRR